MPTSELGGIRRLSTAAKIVRRKPAARDRLESLLTRLSLRPEPFYLVALMGIKALVSEPAWHKIYVASGEYHTNK